MSAARLAFDRFCWKLTPALRNVHANFGFL